MVVPHSQHRTGGTVRIDEDACKQCGQCAQICPAEVLTMQDGHVCIRDDSPFGCIACGHCMMVCPEGNITVTGRGISPDDLLPLPAREEMASADALAALMRSRRSVRRFKDREVDAELLERIVEMASSAPMAIPPWDVGCVVVRGHDKVRQLAAKVIQGYEGFLKIFRPWVLTLMRPLMGKAKHDQFRDFIRPLAQTYVRSHREGHDRSLLGCTRRADIPPFTIRGRRGRGDCLHLRHAGGGIARPGQHDHRRRPTGSATQQSPLQKPGRPRRTQALLHPDRRPSRHPFQTCRATPFRPNGGQ